ncbi:RNA 2',3'-cyclic phosphodiesterase [Bordetella petrii]|uniref:RNA 2',3'-cyclic phosphodiesterase n=1 Tax=Bordetella petrii TaxID=94624 RepID=A0ABT7W7W6_9BORD|nr:RNA 2',3'-cyclic phosphodiesterase [Bordetella petrii]MDM9561217.1 RNA 2',3'-cyclic phosphodiesterase [Bordetella petrii]
MPASFPSDAPASAAPPSRVRLFFALWPGPALAATLADWAAQAQAACGGRVMRPDTLHLTLAFLGAVDAERVPALVAGTARQRATPGSITLDRYGAFARQGIVWAGPPEVGATLRRTYDELWDWLEPLGWRRPAQPFRPHVTLLRRAASLDWPAQAPPPVEWRYDRYLLMESRPQQGTARYRMLASSAA